jgi:tRNA1Val (adenine37-N6)-methyltransferase
VAETTLDSIRDIRLHQHREGYRFSLDAVLLASFVRAPAFKNIADLGAGSGVVGLLLARRYPRARVVLVELQDSLYRLARKNIRLNGLEERVSAVLADLRNPPEDLSGFDLVVSNPPYRRPASGRLSEHPERALARHELALPLGDFLAAAAALAKTRGRVAFIHLPGRLRELVAGMEAVRLEPKRLRFVHGRPGAEAKMVLVEAVKGGRAGLKVEPPLFVRSGGEDYTPEVRALLEP